VLAASAGPSGVFPPRPAWPAGRSEAEHHVIPPWDTGGKLQLHCGKAAINVNAPPPKGGGFGLRLKAGLVPFGGLRSH
jgi:hypothetical protein